MTMRPVLIIFYCGLICMTAVFAILFLLYAKYRVKYCDSGSEDEEIESDFEEELARRNKRCEESGRALLSDKDVYNDLKKCKRVCDLLLDVLYILLIAVSAVLLAFSIVAMTNYYRGKQTYFGNTAYFIVETSSMSYKEEKNPYYESLPDDQIAQYSLIKIDKEKEIELYDIIAYRYTDPHTGAVTVYVHRVVKIYEENGATYYAAMGDTNNVSLSFEKALTRDDVLGVYTGWSSLHWGRFLTFLRSPSGVLAIALVAAFLLFYDVARSKVENAYDGRVELVVMRRIGAEGAENPETESDKELEEESDEELEEESDEELEEEAEAELEEESDEELEEESEEEAEADGSEEEK